MHHSGLAIFPTEISAHKIDSAMHRATKSFYYGHRNINTPVLAQLYCCYEARVTRFQSRYTLLSMAAHTLSGLSRQIQRRGCARIIECNRSSSAHHRVCTFFQPFSTLLVKGLAMPGLLEMSERQSPDGNKHPRGTPTILTLVRPKSASS